MELLNSMSRGEGPAAANPTMQSDGVVLGGMTLQQRTKMLEEAIAAAGVIRPPESRIPRRRRSGGLMACP